MFVDIDADEITTEAMRQLVMQVARRLKVPTIQTARGQGQEGIILKQKIPMILQRSG